MTGGRTKKRGHPDQDLSEQHVVVDEGEIFPVTVRVHVRVSFDSLSSRLILQFVRLFARSHRSIVMFFGVVS